mgnify:CR=1 FL=1
MSNSIMRKIAKFIVEKHIIIMRIFRWKKVKTKCEYRKNNRVLVEPRWYFAAASIALLLTIGGFW